MIVSYKYRAYPDATVETRLNTALDTCRWLYNNAGAWTAFDGMYWDDTTSRLGIGTTSPGSKLTVRGATAYN